MKNLVSSSRKKPGKKLRKTIENDETCLHMHCQQWLVKSGMWDRLLIFHVANERKGGIGAILHFKRMGVREGVADYLLFRPRRGAFAIELKDEDGKQNNDQKKFQAKWEACGHIYLVVRTLEEFQCTVGAVALFD